MSLRPLRAVSNPPGATQAPSPATASLEEEHTQLSTLTWWSEAPLGDVLEEEQEETSLTSDLIQLQASRALLNNMEQEHSLIFDLLGEEHPLTSALLSLEASRALPASMGSPPPPRGSVTQRTPPCPLAGSAPPPPSSPSRPPVTCPPPWTPPLHPERQ